jgi:hypothetical protein
MCAVQLLQMLEYQQRFSFNVPSMGDYLKLFYKDKMEDRANQQSAMSVWSSVQGMDTFKPWNENKRGEIICSECYDVVGSPVSDESMNNTFASHVYKEEAGLLLFQHLMNLQWDGRSGPLAVDGQCNRALVADDNGNIRVLIAQYSAEGKNDRGYSYWNVGLEHQVDDTPLPVGTRWFLMIPCGILCGR